LKILKDRIKNLQNDEILAEATGLLKDLIGEDGKNGQVEEAFDIHNTEDTYFYAQWGKHFIPSMIHAHKYRECNNFADPGVQNYGSDSFKKMRDDLNDIYENLPPPKMSIKHRTNNVRHVTNMAAYNFRGGCFTGDSKVQLVSGEIKKIENLKKGEKVLCQETGQISDILCLIAMGNKSDETGEVIRFTKNGLGITPYHPVKVNGEWRFPENLVDGVDVVRENFNDVVYNVVTTGKSLSVNGVIACTLGHGLTEEVVQHDYFGNRNKIIADLKNFDIQGFENGFVVLGDEVEFVRNERNNKVEGMRIKPKISQPENSKNAMATFSTQNASTY